MWLISRLSSDLLISNSSSGLEILIRDFNPRYSQLSDLFPGEFPFSDIPDFAICYPLQEYSISTYYPIHLHISIFDFYGDDGFSRLAQMSYGSHISWSLSLDFARQLFDAFLPRF